MNEAEVTASERPTSKRPPKKSYPAKSSKSQPNPDLKAQVPFPGIESVMHGNGAVAHVMEHVCDGVIGYPITPSTEISEIYEAYRASGGINVWDRRPFFFEPEGEHSAQSGAMGAALTGGKYISNASSSQGILYGLESHFVTAGKKIGGFVLQIAARVVSRNSLNVMAGHDDVYALLPSGYTIFFGSNPQEAADLAAIAYRSSSLSLIPAANAMDGFSTSHMQSEVLLPEPELLKRYLGDPSERIPCPSVAQEILFGARGRYWQLNHFLEHHSLEFDPEAFDNLQDFLKKNETQLDLDSIAKGMSELASSSRMPASFGMTEGLMKSTALIPQTDQEVAQELVSSHPLVSISEEDLPLCSNCKSCYQDAGELFEATTILVDGSSKEVARVIPGVLENLEMTPELVAKAERAAADCDSEIIHFQSPH